MVKTSAKSVLAGLLILGAAWGPIGDSLAQQAGAAHLEAVQVVDGETTTVALQLSSSVEGAAIASFLLSNPERLVIEVPEAQVAEQPYASAGLGGLVTSVETEQVSDEAGQLLRITLHLSRSADHIFTAEGDTINVAFSGRSQPDTYAAAPASDRALSGPALSPDAPPTVATLDFQNLDDVGRVIIGMSGDLDYDVSRPEPNLVVIDFPGAALAPSLERPLDASQFINPVRTVKAYRTRNGTRVAINLRGDTEFKAHRGAGNLVYIDVDVPASMKADRELAEQGYTGAAPSTPSSSGSEGLKSAHHEELLIGASGRTSKPQDIFGAGAGSHDPSSLMGMAAGFMFDTASASSIPYSGQRINLDLVNADIHSVFRLISHVSKLNIVSGDDVVGEITVRLENVPWDQAFGAILQAKGLGSQRFGNIVRIAPIETIKAEQQSALEAKRATDELEDLQTYVVPLNYAQADELSAQVQAQLSERGTVEVDSRTNQLIVRDREANIAAVRELLRQLDTQNPQVLIEARIVEASSNFTRGLGVQWGSELDASASTGYATGAFFPNSIGMAGGLSMERGSAGIGEAIFYQQGGDNLLVDLASPTGELGALAMHLGSIPGLIDLDARLSAMESEGWGKVVSSPRVVTMDNQQATIVQGAKIPYLATSAGGANVKFVDAALELVVTPHITSDGRISLDVEVKNDRPDFSQLVMGQPAILEKEATTMLLVDNGDTTVIGGVYAMEASETRSKIPFFSKIPLLGYLFRNTGTTISRNELLVFITPRVLTSKVTASNQ